MVLALAWQAAAVAQASARLGAATRREQGKCHRQAAAAEMPRARPRRRGQQVLTKAVSDGSASEVETSQEKASEGEEQPKEKKGPPARDFVMPGGEREQPVEEEQPVEAKKPLILNHPQINGVDIDMQDQNDRKVGRAALYMRELLSRQTRVNRLSRAGSMTDSSVLRRKGRLKEQDPLIEFLVDLHKTHTPLEACTKVQDWIKDACDLPTNKRNYSKLYRMIPNLGYMFHALPLVKALTEYDEFSSLTKRRYVLPNFAEVRHILNIAQVHASSKEVRMVTFDADGTLYQDGAHFEEDNKMIDKIMQLMDLGIHVAIVTAAGYPGEPLRFEGRLRGLLDAFKEANLPMEVTDKFHVMGGECNYLLRLNKNYHLEFIPDDEWLGKDPKIAELYEWQKDDEKVQAFLDRGQDFLEKNAEELGIAVDVIRKQYAVGIVPTSGTIYENLEEMSLAAQAELSDAEVPFCAFNGGNDVFVDVGNKNIGLRALMQFFGIEGHQSLHVGDRFTLTGNDTKVRDACSILWVASPDETTFFMRLLYRDIVAGRIL